MKIMFNMMTMEKGGAERVIANISNYLIKQNEIILVSSLNEQSEYILNDKIKNISITNKRKKTFILSKVLSKISYKKIVNLKKVIIEEKPDIIVAFLPEPSLRILFLKKYCKKIAEIPIIISVRNDPKIEYKNFIIRWIMKRLYPLADGLVFQTNDATEYFNKIINCKSKIILNPVNSNFITNEYHGIREKRIVTVGRIEKQKNHKLLIQAFNIINKTHKDYKLEIYGDGSLRKKLEKQVKKMNLESSIKFKGKVDNIENEIYNAKLFIITSNYEGMPNCLLEALALGLPCISTDCPCGGARDLINNINGMLIPVNNLNKIVESINKVIEDEKFAKELTKNTDIVKKTYNIERISNEWELFIKEVLEERRKK